MDAGDAVHAIARLHARHGTTSFLATTMTAPLGDIEAALREYHRLFGGSAHDQTLKELRRTALSAMQLLREALAGLQKKMTSEIQILPAEPRKNHETGPIQI